MSKALVPAEQGQRGRTIVLKTEQGRILKARYADFLPDAQAVVEKEHSPAARVLTLVLAAFVAALVTYLSVVEVDQVATAQGVVRPAGRVKIINHPTGGTVAVIYVSEGQTVHEGDPLIELDPSVQQEEVVKWNSEVQQLTAEVARLEGEAHSTEPVFPDDLIQVRPDLIAAQMELYTSRQNDYASRREAAQQQVNQNAERVASLERSIVSQNEIIASKREQLASIMELVEKGYFPRIRAMSLEQEVHQAELQMEEFRGNLATARAALGESQSAQTSLTEEWQSAVLGELGDANNRLSQARASLSQQVTTTSNLIVYAPSDGIIQGLMVNNLGQSVRPSEELMRVVPVEDTLIIETKVSNRDIGRIEIGMPAVVKVDTFDPIRYGTLDGTVEQKSADSTLDERTGQYYFTVTIRTDRTYLGSAETPFYVQPGNTTTVNVVIGRRTIMAVLTDRLRQTANNAFVTN